MSQENPISKQPLMRHVNRQQMSWRAVDVEHLISEDHLARAIWTLVGRLNLSAFYQAIESSTEEGGRPAIDPQLLISLWVYAYSQGIGSAREVARRCAYDPCSSKAVRSAASRVPRACTFTWKTFLFRLPAGTVIPVGKNFISPAEFPSCKKRSLP